MWIYVVINRNIKNCGYFLSTVVLKQYTIISQHRNFHGQLPKKVAYFGIENENTNNLIKDFAKNKVTHNDFYQHFISETELGKSHQRISDLFGLRTTGLTLKKSQKSKYWHEIVLLVEPDPKVHGTKD